MEQLRKKRDAYYFKCAGTKEYTRAGCEKLNETQFGQWAAYDRRLNRAAAKKFKAHNFNVMNYCVFIDGLFRGSFPTDLEAINAVIHMKMYPDFPFQTFIAVVPRNMCEKVL